MKCEVWTEDTWSLTRVGLTIPSVTGDGNEGVTSIGRGTVQGEARQFILGYRFKSLDYTRSYLKLQRIRGFSDAV